MKYRREIDGLRALAVIPVILFHAGFHSFSGGFIGVDIFFVISGYLITSIIFSEINTNTFSIINFYERRARRILPALFLVILACLLLSWTLLPSDLNNFSKSIVAVNFFASNWFFLKQSNYFAPDAELSPLLHTWSLAVEEQYYMLFPIFLMLAWRFGFRWLVSLLAGVFVMSIASAQWTSINNPAFGFFMLPTRIWELLIGAFIAFYFTKSNKSSSQSFSIIGLLLIIYSIFSFDNKTPFPSLYTLIPTAGAGLIILFATPQTFAGKLLGRKVFVGVGLISYSAYLWHQPLFAFAKYNHWNEEISLLMAYLIGLTFVLAYLTWKYVETPFRNKQLFNRKQIFIYGFIGSICFVTIGLSGYFTNGFLKLKTTDDQLLALETAQSSPKRNLCHTGGAHYLKPKDACEYHPGVLSWAVFGDSHSVELAYALADELKKSGTMLKHFSFSACIPTYGRDLSDGYKNCSDWTDEAIEYIAKNKDIKNIVVSYRVNAALSGVYEVQYPNLNNVTSETEREQRWDSYVKTLHYFVSQGKNVVLVLQAPELPKTIEELVLKSTDAKGEVIGVSRPWWNERSKYVTMRLNEIPKQVIIVDPARFFCNETHCFAANIGISYYFDNNHMSIAGARLVTNEIIKTVNIVSKQSQ